MAEARAALLALLFATAPALAQEEAVPEPPSPPAPIRPATIVFRANTGDVRVHYATDPVLEDDGHGGLRVRLPDPHRYALLCEAPCDRELPRAHFALAFSRGGAMIRAPEPFGVDGHTRVDVRWDDRRTLRDAGALTLAIGIPLGILLAVLPISIDRATGGEEDAMWVTMGAGTVVLAASIAVGLALYFFEDTVTFAFAPLPDPEGVYSEAWE